MGGTRERLGSKNEQTGERSVMDIIAPYWDDFDREYSISNARRLQNIGGRRRL